MIRLPKSSLPISDILTRDSDQSNAEIVEVNANASLPLGQVLLLFLSPVDSSSCMFSNHTPFLFFHRNQLTDAVICLILSRRCFSTGSPGP